MSAFQDKLEGHLTTIDRFFVDGGADLLHNLVNNQMVAALGQGLNPPSVIEAAREKDRLFREKFKSRTFDTAFGQIAVSEDNLPSVIVEKMKNWLDVSCWDGNEFESIAMWRIYGGSDNSVCVQTTIGDLISSLDVGPALTGYVGRVNYIGHKEDVYIGGNDIGYFMRKHNAYEYEQEIRIIVLDAGADPLSHRSVEGTAIPVDINSLIKLVKISPEAPKWFVDLVASIVRSRYRLSAQIRASDLDELE